MDPQLQAKIDEARANGYTDEEINAYIANQGQPLAVNPPMDRSEEYLGLAQGIGLETAKTAAEIGGLALGGKYLLNAAGKAFRPGPVAPTVAPAGSAQATMDILKSANPQATAQAAQQAQANQSIMQRGMDIAGRMRQAAAARVVPVAGPAAVMSGVAAVPGAMMYDAYRNYQTQTPEERKRSAMEALSGQGLGQVGIY